MDKSRYELYLEMAKQTHQNPNTWTGSHLRDYHIGAISELIQQQGIKTVLDYGCGKALFHQKEWNATLYDPAVPEYSNEPTGKFDLVICTDVLEHIPEEDIPRIVQQLKDLTQGWLYISVCPRLAGQKLTLPDSGEEVNSHVCVKPPEWWQEQINGKKIILKFTD